ncbi:hypothetical protein HAX54_008456 [Datura stramonium]|uniref:Terpene synthase N-terminal domain-containing protein n=1 Tax=Datura stramonium TaxID=4076 RepID=A0ABS8TF22_DATST|nr:hypothetical protein [Datura stramonium]
MLNRMRDGSSSVSPYDTAWVALIRDTNGSSDKPQFPSCLQWIAENQLCDGSWGEELVFCIYDRLLNTLASVVALTTWNIGLENRNRDKSPTAMYNLYRCSQVSFPGEKILDDAKKFTYNFLQHCLSNNQSLDKWLIAKDIPGEIRYALEVPWYANLPRVEARIYLEQYGGANDIWIGKTLHRIPKDVVHTIPTTLLFSLEGFRDLDWERLLKLQMPDGSFLTSIASTAFAFMETNDQNCLRYLQRVVQKYNGGAPHSYPVDMQARLWAIDRLQRLGISYYFEEEFKDMLDHVQRCSQVSFPGEKILDDAKKFTYNFLQHCLSNNQSLDKWLIAKDIPGEIRYALEVPWYANLPRVEARIYLEQYGGANDIWIGKTLHRMPNVNNNVYLEAAKLDYDKCQSQHQLEWTLIQDNETRQMLLNNLLQFLHQLSEETYETLGKDIHLQLHSVWGRWLMSVGEEKTACQEKAELVVRTINLCGGHMVDDDIISSIDYKNISDITNKVCFKLQTGKVSGGINCNIEVESGMKALVKLVLQNSSCGINKDMKKTFLAVAKTFYYTAHVTEEILNFHISKVLFESVLE